jgi:hypothetical protein
VLAKEIFDMPKKSKKSLWSPFKALARGAAAAANLGWRASCKLTMGLYYAAVVVIAPATFIAMCGVLYLYITNPNPAKVLKDNREYVVQMVYSKGEEHSHLGTGFYVQAPSGSVYILTNRHICMVSDDGYVSIRDYKTQRPIRRRIIEMYGDHDLCLVESLPGRAGLQMAESVDTGQLIHSIGYPIMEALEVSTGMFKAYQPIQIIVGANMKKGKCYGSAYTEKKIKVPVEFDEEAGEIVEADMKVCVFEALSVVSSLRVFPGSSGSPIVDEYGKLVGVIFAYQLPAAWGWAVPLYEVQNFLAPY